MESGLLTNLSFRRPESCEKNFYFYYLRYLFIPGKRIKWLILPLHESETD